MLFCEELGVGVLRKEVFALAAVNKEEDSDELACMLEQVERAIATVVDVLLPDMHDAVVVVL